MDFLAIKRNLPKDYSPFKSYKLAILSDTASQFLAQALRGMAYEHQIDLQLYEAQASTEINDPNSGLYQFEPNGVFWYHSLIVLKTTFYKKDLANRKDFAQQFLDEIKTQVEKLPKKGIHHIFVNTFAVTTDAIFGQYGLQTENSFSFQLQKVNAGLSELAAQTPSIALLQLPLNHFDSQFYYYSNSDISFQTLPDVAYSFMQLLSVRLGKTKKCIVLDLDNTIWGGTVGDDGWENLELGNLRKGKVFTDVQLWLRELKNRGILLAVCSKNEESTAKEVFEKHPDMVLGLDDIALFIANWDSKPENIRNIFQLLNIGTDSLVFLDDNTAERELVKTVFPEITVPDLPKDPAEWLEFLQKQNLFETFGLTNEDLSRTEKYQQESHRKQSEKTFTNLGDYLKSLEMKVKVLPIDSFTLPRVTQLLQRTNQFNLRTLRHSELEIKEMIDSDQYTGFALSLSDKFGDEGIVSAILLKQELNALFIDTWVMSCRVFGRGLEFFAFNSILDESINSNKILKAEYLPTPKNQYVKNLLSDLGLTEKGGYFELKPNETHFKSHFINQ